MKVVRREFWKKRAAVYDCICIYRNICDRGWFFCGQKCRRCRTGSHQYAYPLVALIQAAGSGLGMAGAIQIAINKGKKDEQEERRYLGNAIILLAVAGIVLMAGLSLAI